MLSIIVLNYNKLEYSKKTILNILKITQVSHELILVDNGSIDGTKKFLNAIKGNPYTKRILRVFNERNLGVAGGKNTGLRVARGDYLMCIDNDIILPRKYDKKLIEACDKIPNLGLTGVNVEKKQYPIRNINGVKMQIKSGNLGGGCLCMTRHVFENKLGYFRPDYIYGGEDVDMYIRVKILGLLSAYIEPKGKHIGTYSDNVSYKSLKKYIHSKRSKMFRKIGDNENTYKKTGKVYISYKEPHIRGKKIDDAIKKPILDKKKKIIMQKRGKK